MENSLKTSQSDSESQGKWPVVALRMAKEDLDAVQQFTGESSYGKAAKAAVLEFLRMKRDGAMPPKVSAKDVENVRKTPSKPTTEPEPQPKQPDVLPQIAESLAALTQIIKGQKSIPQSARNQANMTRVHNEPVVTTPEQDAIYESLKITEEEFKTFFNGRRARGQRDSTPENEDAFWQYLLLVDFTRTDGSPVTKRNVGQVFNAWVRIENENKGAMAEKAKFAAEAAAKKKEAEEKAEADRKAYEDWNDRMLRWDGDDEL